MSDDLYLQTRLFIWIALSLPESCQFWMVRRLTRNSAAASRRVSSGSAGDGLSACAANAV